MNTFKILYFLSILSTRISVLLFTEEKISMTQVICVCVATNLEKLQIWGFVEWPVKYADLRFLANKHATNRQATDKLSRDTNTDAGGGGGKVPRLFSPPFPPILGERMENSAVRSLEPC
jgi:hypothetical protein